MKPGRIDMRKALLIFFITILVSSTVHAQWGGALNFASGEYTEAYPLYWGNYPYNEDTVLTIECWVKWEGTTGNDQPIAYNGDISTGGYGIYLSNDKLEILMSEVDTLRSNVALPLNVWTYLAAVRTSGSWKLFVNGVSQTISNSSSVPASPGLYFYVGANDDYSDQQYFNGAIDEVRISSVARHNSNFTRPSSPFKSDSQTVALYHFDESAGDTAHDATGNGNDLAIYGASWVSDDNPLAVQAVDFLVATSDGTVKLSWKTQSEVGNLGFNILREDPGTDMFKLIASYTSDNELRGLGTSSTGESYNFADNKVISGKTYQYKVQSVSTNGVIKNVSTLSVTVNIPKTYALYQNYPNPFNPTTMISYQLPVVSHVTLKVYDILGREVATLVDGQQNAGVYKAGFDGSWLASGVYFYRIVAVGNSTKGGSASGGDGQKFVSVKKLMLMK
jgi:hypothetical protein